MRISSTNAVPDNHSSEIFTLGNYDDRAIDNEQQMTFMNSNDISYISGESHSSTALQANVEGIVLLISRKKLKFTYDIYRTYCMTMNAVLHRMHHRTSTQGVGVKSIWLVYLLSLYIAYGDL